MPSTVTSLALTEAWDIALDTAGGLAVVDGAARIAQDVACYERTFYGEPWYATQEGVPYLQNELGDLPPLELVRERANRRALEVPDVAEAATVLTSLEGRVLRGVIYVTDITGEAVNVTI